MNICLGGMPAFTSITNSQVDFDRFYCNTAFDMDGITWYYRSTTRTLKTIKLDKRKYYFLLIFHQQPGHQIVPYICACAKKNICFLGHSCGAIVDIVGLRGTTLALHICKFSRISAQVGCQHFTSITNSPRRF